MISFIFYLGLAFIAVSFILKQPGPFQVNAMIQKILIVDDSSVARRMLKSCIPREKGYDIFEASDGAEAIEKYQQHSPDLTFMDLTMPNVDGYEAIAEIMRNDKNAMIVVATADIQPKSIRRVKSLGVFDVLRKPPKPDLIQEYLERVEYKLEQTTNYKS
jgi:two-component system chemotaxis response regulator CheY